MFQVHPSPCLLKFLAVWQLSASRVLLNVQRSTTQGFAQSRTRGHHHRLASGFRTTTFTTTGAVDEVVEPDASTSRMEQTLTTSKQENAPTSTEASDDSDNAMDFNSSVPADSNSSDDSSVNESDTMSNTTTAGSVQLSGSRSCWGHIALIQWIVATPMFHLL
eukprot:s4233_g4.t1